MSRMAPRPGPKARKYALRQVGHTQSAAGMCQKFTRTCFGTPPNGGSATEAWYNAVARGEVVHETNPDKIPKNCAVYFTGGSHGYGHACVSYRKGKVVTTDWVDGRYVARAVGKAHVADLERAWGLELKGYIFIDSNGYQLRNRKHPDSKRKKAHMNKPKKHVKRRPPEIAKALKHAWEAWRKAKKGKHPTRKKRAWRAAQWLGKVKKH